MVETIPGGVYEQCVLEARMHKIQQKLLWYDNLPPDEEVVNLVKEWNELYHRHSRLVYSMATQDAAGVGGDTPPAPSGERCEEEPGRDD